MGEIKKKPFYESDIYEVRRMEHETGKGISTSFQVFPGIYPLHSDFHMKEANQALSEFVKGISIDVYTIRDKFVSEGQPFITKGTAVIHHIFEEIEQAPWEGSGEYYKIKVLELLLRLKNMERRSIPLCVPTVWIWRDIYWQKQGKL